jgi:hypothetical protein
MLLEVENPATNGTRCGATDTKEIEISGKCLS